MVTKMLTISLEISKNTLNGFIYNLSAVFGELVYDLKIIEKKNLRKSAQLKGIDKSITKYTNHH
jgi:hypothetical protein